MGQLACITDVKHWHLKTEGGIPYRLVSRRGSTSNEDDTGVEEYLIRTSDLGDFLVESFPPPTVIVGVSLSNNRLMPGTNIPTVKVDYETFLPELPIDPFGGDDNKEFDDSYSDYTKVTIEYNNANKQRGEVDQNDPVTFLEISANAAGEFIHVAAPKAQWKNTKNAQEDGEQNQVQRPPITILVPETEWTVRWPLINRAFFNNVLVHRLRAAMGRVNSTAISLFRDAPAETILFVGWSLEEEYRTGIGGQNLPVSVEFKFLEKYLVDEDGNIRGHNDFWDNRVGGWQYILLNGIDPTYASYDFNAIWAPP